MVLNDEFLLSMKNQVMIKNCRTERPRVLIDYNGLPRQKNRYNPLQMYNSDHEIDYIAIIID